MNPGYPTEAGRPLDGFDDEMRDIGRDYVASDAFSVDEEVSEDDELCSTEGFRIRLDCDGLAMDDNDESFENEEEDCMSEDLSNGDDGFEDMDLEEDDELEMLRLQTLSRINDCVDKSNV